MMQNFVRELVKQLLQDRRVVIIGGDLGDDTNIWLQ